MTYDHSLPKNFVPDLFCVTANLLQPIEYWSLFLSPGSLEACDFSHFHGRIVGCLLSRIFRLLKGVGREGQEMIKLSLSLYLYLFLLIFGHWNPTYLFFECTAYHLYCPPLLSEAWISCNRSYKFGSLSKGQIQFFSHHSGLHADQKMHLYFCVSALNILWC